MTGEGRDPEVIPLRDRPIDLPVPAIGHPVRTLPQPIPVRAWICLPRRGFLLVDAEAIAYTPVAGRVRFCDEHGRRGSVWLWAAAISRRDSGERSA